MCVIIIASKFRPSDKVIEEAFDANKDGFGIAWRDFEKDKETKAKVPVVRWEKGRYDLKDCKAFIEKAPLPFVLHFRIATGGTVISNEMCHPFPVEHTAPLWTSGHTGGYVLFHNGHWGKWREHMLETSVRLPVDIKIPDGDWTDTRAMAWQTAYRGKGFINFLDEKVVLFSPTEVLIWKEAVWERVEGLLCSNNFFYKRPIHTHNGGTARGFWPDSSYMRPACRFGECKRRDTNADGFCPVHESADNGHPNVKGKLEDGKIRVTRYEGGTQITEWFTWEEIHNRRRKDGTEIKGVKVDVSGGDVTKLPFPMVAQMWQDDMISKKQFKRARRKWMANNGVKELPLILLTRKNLH